MVSEVRGDFGGILGELQIGHSSESVSLPQRSRATAPGRANTAISCKGRARPLAHADLVSFIALFCGVQVR